jgi:energy-coupling factor transporter ATP-binding protein EcfA2
MDETISYFAVTNARPPHRQFGLYQSDRLQHVYVIGKTGTGKSTLLETLIAQDIAHGRGVILLDPHGDLASRIAAGVPKTEQHRLIYMDTAGAAGRFGYNPLKHVAEPLIPLAVSGLLEAFRHHFGEKAWGPRMEHIFRNVLYTLLERGDATLPDVLWMLSDKAYRQTVVAGVRNPQVRYFFEHEFSKLWGRTLADAVAPIQNKVGAFLTDPRLVATLVDFQTPVSFRAAMDEQAIVLVNLARGILGSDTSDLLGSLLTSTISLAALSRQSLPSEKRMPAFLYLDEFEHFLTPATADLLSVVRKVGLSVTLANQYLAQLPDGTRAAILGNVGTLICFRVGPEDAALLSRQFGNDFMPSEFQDLANHDVLVQMMMRGEMSRGFSATTRGFLTSFAHSSTATIRS